MKYLVGLGICIGLMVMTVPSLQASATNGSLLTAHDDSRVYYIEAGKKRHIRSPQVFESRFAWDQIIRTSAEDLAAIPEGHPMGFGEGSLIASNSTVYVISDAKKRPFASREAFLQKGYRWSNVRAVSPVEASFHDTGSPITVEGDYPNGSLLRSPTGHIYVIEGDQKRYIPSPLVFMSRYSWRSVIDVSQSRIDQYPDGSWQTFGDGMLLANNQGVFITENNTKRPIVSPEIFESYGFLWSQVLQASDFELELLAMGPNIATPRSYADGTLLISRERRMVYRVQNETLEYVWSPAMFKSYGKSWSALVEISDRAIEKFPKGSFAKFQDGSVIASGGTVYLIENGYKRPFANPGVFLARGYQWSQMIIVSLTEAGLHPTGSIIGDVATANLEGYAIPASSGKVATEQHLARDCNEAPEDHYARSNTGINPAWLRNGMLSSGGAFAAGCPAGSRNSSASSANIEEEKYYITMRWNYVNWYESRTTLTGSIGMSDMTIPVSDASNFPNSGYIQIGSEIIGYTKTSDTSLQVVARGHDAGSLARESNAKAFITTIGPSAHGAGSGVIFVYKYGNASWRPRTFTSLISNTSQAKTWHHKKRVLVTNPATGKMIIASIIESGPAIFTDRVAGLSPEAMYALGATTDSTLTYGFMIDQSRPVGPIN